MTNLFLMTLWSIHVCTFWHRMTNDHRRVILIVGMEWWFAIYCIDIDVEKSFQSQQRLGTNSRFYKYLVLQFSNSMEMISDLQISYLGNIEFGHFAIQFLDYLILTILEPKTLHFMQFSLDKCHIWSCHSSKM